MADIADLVRTDFKAVDKRDALHSVKGWLTGDTTKVPIVLDNGRPFGIVNHRALMGRSMALDAHVAQFTLNTRAITPDTSLDEARRRMAEHRAAYLPVADAKGKLTGYVSAVDLFRVDMNGQKASELALPVTVLREDQTMGEALNVFTKEYVEYLPVVGRDGRVSGVLARAEVLKMEFNAGDKGRKDAGGEKFTMLNDPISGFMSNAPNTVPPATTAEALVDALEEEGYAIVGDQTGSPMGLVTPETLFRVGGH